MRSFALTAAGSLLLASCGSAGNDSAPDPGNEADVSGVNEAAAVNDSAAAAVPGFSIQEPRSARWDLQSSGEGAALALIPASGGTAMRLFCPSGQNRLLVNVPGFRPIGSEERLSFGGGGDAVALVANTRGDVQRGGVSGTGQAPANLAALLRGPVSASYGTQTSGPHPAPPQEVSRAFVAACAEGSPRPEAPTPPAPPPSAGSSPCLVQGSERLSVAPLRAVGTEPFWAARIEGRCVTYSHPEDQSGTRIWTRFTPSPGGGTWVGALNGRLFELRARPQPGCSDGMSDKRYPIAVDLVVGGERRSGCAEPA